MHAGPHHCVRTRWEGPTGAGGCRMVACDMTHIMNHVHAHLVGLERASRSLNFLHLLTYYDYSARREDDTFFICSHFDLFLSNAEAILTSKVPK